MARSIGWAILGTGGVARSFAEDLKTIPDARLVAVGSRSQANASAFARSLGVPRFYDDYSAAALDSEVDVVYVATPHSRHTSDCVTVLEANKALLCEKPFALTADDARTVRELAVRKNKFCMEAMWTRFLPVVTEARERIRAGEIGELISISADFGYPAPRGLNNRLLDPLLGGGAMLDRGVYGVSLANWFFGPPDVVKATAAINQDGVDEHSQALLGWSTGRSAVVTASLVTRTNNTAMLVGTKGSILLHEPFCCPPGFTVRHDGSLAGSFGNQRKLPGARQLGRIFRKFRRGGRYVPGKRVGHGYRYEASEVNRCLIEGLLESPTMPLHETVTVMEVMDAILRDFNRQHM